MIASLGKWAARSPLHDPTLPMSHVSVMMSLQTLISTRARRRASTRRIGFRFGETSYVATVHDGALDVERGDAGDCDVDLHRLRRASSPPSSTAARRSTRSSVEGDLELAKRFVDAVPAAAKGRLTR